MIESQVLLLQIQLLRNAICSASPPKKCQRIGWKFCTLATFRRNWAEIEFAAGAAPSQKNLKTRWKGQEDGNEWKGSIEQQDRSEIPRLSIFKKIQNFLKIWIWRLFLRFESKASADCKTSKWIFSFLLRLLLIDVFLFDPHNPTHSGRNFLAKSKKEVLSATRDNDEYWHSPPVVRLLMRREAFKFPPPSGRHLFADWTRRHVKKSVLNFKSRFKCRSSRL